ncbi:uncharacterized protein [Symphalangus syndactylus]|uniref:uncharacterized protein n=1 Tax=Symphalangus syndactylus TaxID=9590 RepID=UPI0030059196
MNTNLLSDCGPYRQRLGNCASRSKPRSGESPTCGFPPPRHRAQPSLTVRRVPAQGQEATEKPSLAQGGRQGPPGVLQGRASDIATEARAATSPAPSSADCRPPQARARSPTPRSRAPPSLWRRLHA